MGGSIPYKVGVTLQVKPKDSGPIPKEWLRKTTLQAPFGDFGQILRIDVSETQRCAYVEYEDPRDAQDAQKDLDGKRIAGKEVSVLLAGQTPNRRPGSSPMPVAVPERAVDIEQRVAEMAMKHFLDEAAAARLASVFQDRSRLGCNLVRDFQDLDEHLSASNKPSALREHEALRASLGATHRPMQVPGRQEAKHWRRHRPRDSRQLPEQQLLR